MNSGAGYGLEIPVQYKLFRIGKTANWADKSVRKVIESMEKITTNCTL